MKKIFESDKLIIQSLFDEDKRTMCLRIIPIEVGTSGLGYCSLAVPEAIKVNRVIEQWINSQ